MKPAGGLYKLQLITEAKRVCPDVVVILGEDLTRFRDHSKDLYRFLSKKIWSGRAEKLGFDEVWLDITDMIDYNVSLINWNDRNAAWFCMDRGDPTVGFAFDASVVQGNAYPSDHESRQLQHREKVLSQRLSLASHLAYHLRRSLEIEKGFTSTVGVSTNKELSKMTGNLHKPNAQTTLMPPYNADVTGPSNVLSFLDGHEIGKIPGIGHKGAAAIRDLVRGHEVGYKDGLVTKFTKEKVTVSDVRNFPNVGPEILEQILSGPGTPKGFGGKLWELLHGVDDQPVERGRDIPKQISIEDTYLRLSDMKSARRKLILLSVSLLRRMRTDLTDEEELEDEDIHLGHDAYVRRVATDDGLSLASNVKKSMGSGTPRRWIAHPRTVRLSTRERKAQRSFARVSRSAPMPNFVFSLEHHLEVLATKLTDDSLMPMLSKLVSERAGFDLFLLNVAATNMQEAAGEKGGLQGRDISKMFRTQEKVLKEWRIPNSSLPTADEPTSPRQPPDTAVQARAMTPIESSAFQAVVSGDCYQPGCVNRPSYLLVEMSHLEAQGPSQNPFFGSEDLPTASQKSGNTAEGDHWESDEDGHSIDGRSSIEHDTIEICNICRASVPSFALEAHQRYHSEPN